MKKKNHKQHAKGGRPLFMYKVAWAWSFPNRPWMKPVLMFNSDDTFTSNKQVWVTWFTFYGNKPPSYHYPPQLDTRWSFVIYCLTFNWITSASTRCEQLCLGSLLSVRSRLIDKSGSTIAFIHWLAGVRSPQSCSLWLFVSVCNCRQWHATGLCFCCLCGALLTVTTWWDRSWDSTGQERRIRSWVM